MMARGPLALCLACLFVSPEAVAIEVGPEQTIAPFTSGIAVHTRSPATVATDTHLFVAWNELATDGSVEGIALLTLDHQGRTVGGGPRWLNQGTPPERNVALARSGQGFVAAWVCDSPGRICVRRGDATSLGQTVTTSALSASDTPALAATAAGTVLAWADQRTGTQLNSYACVLDASGACVPADGVALRPFPNFAQHSMRAAPSGSSEFVISWYDIEAGATIVLQRVSAAGALVGTANQTVGGCCVAANAASALVQQPGFGQWAAWEDARAGVNIYVRPFDDALGYTLGGEVAVADSGDDEANPWLAWDESRGMLLVTWQNETTGEIEGRERALDGGWSAIGPLASGEQARVAIAGNGRGVLTYQRASGPVDQTYVRLFGPIPSTSSSEYFVGCDCGLAGGSAVPWLALLLLLSPRGWRRRQASGGRGPLASGQ